MSSENVQESEEECARRKRIKGLNAKFHQLLDESSKDPDYVAEASGLPLFSLPMENPTFSRSCRREQPPSDWSAWTGLGITRGFGHENLYPKGFTEEPSIASVTLAPIHKFMILMSDGVHEHLNDDDVVAQVWAELQKQTKLEVIAKKVIEAAARNDKKNRLAGDVDFDTLIRGINDDMAVIIVVFQWE